MKFSRRNLLQGAGGLALGAAAGGLGLSFSGKRTAEAAAGPQPNVPDLPWPYKKLDSETVGEAAYHDYYKGACCYGAFEAIIAPLRKEIGVPYTQFPSTLMVFGEGGVAATGTVCGALNGAAAAIFLITGGMDKKQREVAFALTQELFTWYEQTALPDFRPQKPKFEIGKSVARSSLCHVSVSRWCKAAGFKSFSPQRSERCGWLTGGVARFTVQLLNAHADKSFKAAFPLSAEVKSCRACHDRGGAKENTRGTMDCGGCHFTGRLKHPGK